MCVQSVCLVLGLSKEADGQAYVTLTALDVLLDSGLVDPSPSPPVLSSTILSRSQIQNTLLPSRACSRRVRHFHAEALLLDCHRSPLIVELCITLGSMAPSVSRINTTISIAPNGPWPPLPSCGAPLLLLPAVALLGPMTSGQRVAAEYGWQRARLPYPGCGVMRLPIVAGPPLNPVRNFLQSGLVLECPIAGACTKGTPGSDRARRHQTSPASRSSRLQCEI